AIMTIPKRLRDIDQAVSPNPSPQVLEEALGSVVDRLDYLRIPVNRSSVSGNSIKIRRIRSNETEFREYFALRHRVYTIMGYLDQEVQNTRSRLEINEADTHAMHLGAFYCDGPRETLVGTARVVTNEPPDEDLWNLFADLVTDDPVARQRLND